MRGEVLQNVCAEFGVDADRGENILAGRWRWKWIHGASRYPAVNIVLPGPSGVFTLCEIDDRSDNADSMDAKPHSMKEKRENS